jgi:NAD+ diphosphatase
MSADIGFVPGVLPPAAAAPPDSLCFAFRGSRLLVRRGAGQNHAGPPAGTALPRIGELEGLGLRPARRQFLGLDDGLCCFSWELDPGSPQPTGLEFAELRGLWGSLSERIFWLAGRAFQIMDWDRTHLFCGRCAAPMQAKNDERAKLCPSCGLVSYPRVAPAIIVAVVRDDALLLARATRFPTDMYSVIAGFVDAGESLEECVHREVREEVGLAVRDLRYFASQPWPFPHSLMVAFTARHAGGDIRIDGREIVDAGWYRAGSLPRIPERISVARRLIDWFVESRGDPSPQGNSH